MRKIAIVAKAGTSALAPWRDEEWEIWGMPWISYPRVTRMFEIHAQSVADEDTGDDRESVWLPKFMAKNPDVPVYCHPSRAYAFPNPVIFPFEEVIASIPFPYLENTIAYQLALAIHEKVDEIGLWGVHMMGRSEFTWQRPSVIYLIGLAQGLGIKVTVAPGSPLFMSGYIGGRYGVMPGERHSSILTG
jgi:hypothetical protein